ncbi:MAG TPA: tetratricopeptide repeat protein [Candidatus Angelobacter sp.]|nr:tetratricopeptide repeat protein [Candidatus Angelobacter sp.]
MKASSSLSRVTLLLAIIVCLSAAMSAQKGGKGGSVNKPTTTTNIPPVNTPQPNLQPLFISGKVLVDGGGAPPEPVAIERVCNGVARRQGYTDAKGSFQFQLDQNLGFQDASETTNSIFDNVPQTMTQSQDILKTKYQGCEVRAVLPGFISSTVPLRLQGSTWQYDLGTVFLKRMDSASGSTVSMTTLNAPDDAKHAYEKGRRAFDENKFSDAEKELAKAVKIYPGLAAAWSLLGDIHQHGRQLDVAVKDYQQAISADPQFVNPNFGLGLIAMQEKRWQDAIQFTDKVLKMNAAAFPSAYFYNAVANYNLGRPELAEDNAKRFKTLDTEHRHPDVCLLLGQIFIRKQDLANAAQEMRDFLTIAPNANNAPEVRDQLKRLEDALVAKKQ